MGVQKKQNGQEGNYLKIRIREPYWGAWKKYGWAKGTWGIGLKRQVVIKAGTDGKMILITIDKDYGEYKITPSRAMIVGEPFIAKFNTKLLVVPIDQFLKIE